MSNAQRTLRVGFVIDRWQPSRGGAERALAQLARHLEQRGHTALAFADEGPKPGEDAPGQVHLVARKGWSLSRGGRERAFAEAALRAAEAQDCDVTLGVRHLPRVDVYWPHGGSHARSLAALRAARAWTEAQPSVVTPVTPAGRHRAFVQFERELMEGGGARRVVCVSKLVERELAADFPGGRERLVHIGNGVDLETFHAHDRLRSGLAVRRELRMEERGALIAFVARQPVLKGLPVLFAALSRLRDEDWNLVVAGPRDVAQWRRRARAAGLAEERVRIVAHADSAELLGAADILAHPTWRDTSGLVVLEALASGTPVITTACAGEAESVTTECGTVLERPGDVAGLSEALRLWILRSQQRSVDHDAIRASVAERGQEAWLQRITHELLEAAR
ncbi:MAG: glycosyltransferase family 4 protein [Planctomycetes bacterium]|nr:glycosyltransferase family 4 protein [Planctomycetota bacterium]